MNSICQRLKTGFCKSRTQITYAMYTCRLHTRSLLFPFPHIVLSKTTLPTLSTLQTFTVERLESHNTPQSLPSPIINLSLWYWMVTISSRCRQIMIFTSCEWSAIYLLSSLMILVSDLIDQCRFFREDLLKVPFLSM